MTKLEDDILFFFYSIFLLPKKRSSKIMRGFDGIYVIALVSSTQYQSTRVRAKQRWEWRAKSERPILEVKEKQNGILA